MAKDNPYIRLEQECNCLQEKIDAALKAAVSALYFNDNHDYETALYEIIAELAGQEAADLTFNNSAEAYAKYGKG